MEYSNVVRTVKKVMPAVVSIAIARSYESIEKNVPPELLPIIPFQHGKPRIPDEMIDAHGMITIGGGSGFIVEKTGIIVTNQHVVSDTEAEYTIIMNEGEKYKAEILARDPIDDVAILQITGQKKNFPVVALGESAKLDLGETVLAFGNALGIFKNTVSRGIISGLSRSIRASAEGKQGNPVQELRGLIQTDAAINPGNSGGPLVNLDGEAIGINAAIVSGAQNLGFAIPINAVRRDLEDLKKTGRIRRPLLGLRYLMIDENLKAKMKLSVECGAIVVGQMPHFPAVTPGSPADKAGIKEKDIILACNGTLLSGEKTIQDFLEELSAGDILNLRVDRNGQELDIKVTLAERK